MTLIRVTEVVNMGRRRNSEEERWLEGVENPPQEEPLRRGSGERPRRGAPVAGGPKAVAALGFISSIWLALAGNYAVAAAAALTSAFIIYASRRSRRW